MIVGILSDVNDSKIAANYNAFAGVDKTASDFSVYVKVKNLSKSVIRRSTTKSGNRTSVD